MEKSTWRLVGRSLALLPQCLTWCAQVVFEPCWEAGGIQMTLLPFAIVTLIAYSFGYPAFVGFVVHKNRDAIMEDQLLRAQDMGRTRLDNPHCYDVRKRYHRVYYQYKPSHYYWALCILGRKFLIAFTSLMFNKNPAFQLSVALLVMFAACTYTPIVASAVFMSHNCWCCHNQMRYK